jgi:DNA polymerase-3 subunit delta
VNLKPGQTASFLRRPDPSIRAILVHGSDAGMVRERVLTLMRTVVQDIADPFRVADLTGDQLKADPTRLADEAAAIAFGGGRRVIRVRDAGNESVAALDNLLQRSAGDALVVIEAGALGRESTLRKRCEAADTAAAIACYADEQGDIAGLITEGLGKEGIKVAQDALDFLTQQLGADRRATRGEIEKLALYAGPGGRIELSDAVAAVGDGATVSLDDVAFATGDGDMPTLLRALDRAHAEGLSPVAILRAVARHFDRLHRTASIMASGQRAEDAMKQLRPPVFFRNTGRFRQQVSRWPAAWLDAALERLLRSEIDVKTTGMPARTICDRTLIEMARAAAGRR